MIVGIQCSYLWHNTSVTGVTSVPYTFAVGGSVPRSSIMRKWQRFSCSNAPSCAAALTMSVAATILTTGRRRSELYIAASTTPSCQPSVRIFSVAIFRNASMVATMLFAVVVLPLPTFPLSSRDGRNVASHSQRTMVLMCAFVSSSSTNLPHLLATKLAYACRIIGSTTASLRGTLNRIFSVVAERRAVSVCCTIVSLVIVARFILFKYPSPIISH